MNIELTWLDYQKDVFFNFPDKVKYKIIRKGRRAGITRGGANAFIKKLILKEGPLLWGDTVHGNIERYFERYFQPVLEKNKIKYRFDRRNNKLEIGNQVADFRSADNPENWEGFGYKMIFLNEAGIILKNKSLYVNSVLPMLLDYPDSKLIAAGVPKGKIMKDGNEHPFYTLAKRAETGNENYQIRRFTSYDNPLLKTEDIEELKAEMELMTPEMVDQEVYGEFIEMDAMNPFAFLYNPEKHESNLAVFRPEKQIIIRVDFNLNPFAVTFCHYWRDNYGHHWHVFDEAEIKNGSIPAMVDLIRAKYGAYLHAAMLTGDAMGKRGEIGERDNATLFQQLIRGLGMNSTTQLKVPGNPTHKNSRADVNYVLANFPDYKIHPANCKGLCRDMKIVNCDAYGEIIKKNRKDISQHADLIDTERYGINTFLKQWIKEHQIMNKNRIHQTATSKILHNSNGVH